MKFTKNDAIITVATDGADLYETELAKTKNNLVKFMIRLLVQKFLQRILKQ